MLHNFFVGTLTVLLVLDCLVLILLVLLQLPKKEAGAGIAFGGAAADALFGAGSGNVLTKITKYVAGIFFLIALTLTIANKPGKGPSLLQEELTKKSAVPAASSLPSTNNLLKITPQATNAEKPVVPAPAPAPTQAPAASTNK